MCAYGKLPQTELLKDYCKCDIKLLSTFYFSFGCQIFYHLGKAWDLRWSSSCENMDTSSERQKLLSEPVVPTVDQVFVDSLSLYISLSSDEKLVVSPFDMSSGFYFRRRRCPCSGV